MSRRNCFDKQPAACQADCFDTVLKEGVLFRRSHGSPARWLKRHFVLTEWHLKYYDPLASGKGAKQGVRGAIDLRYATVAALTAHASGCEFRLSVSSDGGHHDVVRHGTVWGVGCASPSSHR